MKHQYFFIVSLLTIILLTACSPSTPSASSIETAIAQTQLARPSPTEYQITATETQLDTLTPTSTIQPTITKTPIPTHTRTPKPTATPYIARWLDKVNNPLNKMVKRVDEFTGTTWYFDKTSPFTRTRNSFQIYIGQGQNTLYLRLLIQYVASNWLFIESYSIKADSKIYNYDVGYYDVERDSGGGRIGEWYDILAGRKEVEMIEAIINSESTVIRFTGKQYIDERTITNEEKQALKNVLAAFEELGGRLDNP